MIQPITFHGDDKALLAALRAGHPGAAAALYDRYAEAVHRTLERTLGPDPDVPDLLQEVFVTAFAHAHKVQEAEKLGAWLARIAVFTARACIRRRVRRRWLWGKAAAPGRVNREASAEPAESAREALWTVYSILDRLPVDERLAFALRILDGRKLEDAAEVAGTSLATFKRRLTRAERRFAEEARNHPVLQEWLAEGTKWTGERTGRA